MTILSSGSTYSLTIPAGNALVTLDLSGTSTVTGVTREDASYWHGTGAKACNPVSTDTAITISTTGLVDYRFVAGDATPSGEEIHYNHETYDMSSSAAAAVAAALGGVIDPGSGEIKLNIIPRTGTLAALMTLSGGAGEVAAATDAPAIVKFTGSVGGAKAITAYDNTITVAGGGALSLKPDARRILISGASPTAVTLAAGYTSLQRLSLVSEGATTITTADGSIAFGVNGAGVLPYGLELEWGHPLSPGAWRVCGLFGASTGNVSVSIAGAQAAGAKSLGLGLGAQANHDNSVAIATYLHKAGYTSTPGELLLGAGVDVVQSIIELKGTGAAGTIELTTDGAAGVADINRIGFTPSGAYRVRLTVLAKATSASKTVGVTLERELLVMSDGSGGISVSAVQTVGTDINTGVTGTAPSLTVTQASGNLIVSLTHGHSASLIARAHVRIVGAYMGV